MGSNQLKTFPEALLGFRRWEVDFFEGALKPCTGAGQGVWIPGINKARCNGYRHEPPADSCHCGFNAWHKLRHAEDSYSGVLGAIAGAGNIELHSNGFRSSEAQIIALLSTGRSLYSKENLEEVSKNYGVPVFTDRQEFLNFVETKATPYNKSGAKVIPMNGPRPIEAKPFSLENCWKEILAVVLTAVVSAGLSAFLMESFFRWINLDSIVGLVFLASIFFIGALFFVLFPTFRIFDVVNKDRDTADWHIALVLGVGTLAVVLATTAVVFYGISLVDHNQTKEKNAALAKEAAISPPRDTAVSIALLQEKYFLENETYTADPNDLDTKFSFKNTSETIWEPVNQIKGMAPFSLKSDGKSFLVLTQVDSNEYKDQNVIAVKGREGTLSNWCSEDLCSGELLRLNDSEKESFLRLYDQLSPENSAESQEILTAEKELNYGQQSSECVISRENPIRGEQKIFEANFLC